MTTFADTFAYLSHQDYSRVQDTVVVEDQR